jgi:hypothetical protein
LVETRVISCIKLSQCKNINYYYHNFKTQFGDQSRARPELRVELTIDSGQHKNKNDYYYSFKTWFKGQYKDKNYYYYSSFKTRLGGQPGQDSGYKLGESTKVDPSQYMDTNDYYHSFKAQLGCWLEIKFMSWVGRVTSADLKFLIFFSKMSTSFLPIFYPKLT